MPRSSSWHPNQPQACSHPSKTRPLPAGLTIPPIKCQGHRLPSPNWSEEDPNTSACNVEVPKWTKCSKWKKRKEKKRSQAPQSPQIDSQSSRLSQSVRAAARAAEDSSSESNNEDQDEGEEKGRGSENEHSEEEDEERKMKKVPEGQGEACLWMRAEIPAVVQQSLRGHWIPRKSRRNLPPEKKKKENKQNKTKTKQNKKRPSGSCTPVAKEMSLFDLEDFPLLLSSLCLPPWLCSPVWLLTWRV
uniref:AP-3 complex subunit beta-2-like n=1 Tax=Halichoerus grypus TaxID=9711 RepID=UPI001659468F|nr:AP-3 complex subunit beta-2-like [Halichoerus grypus]